MKIQSKKWFIFNQDGATLIILIVSLIVIGILGTAINTMTNRSTMGSVNVNYTQRAYYLAESGIRWMEAEYKNDIKQAEEVYKNISDTSVVPGGVIEMGEAHGGGELTMDIHPFFGRYDSTASSTGKLFINFPGTLDPDVFDIDDGDTETTNGKLWHNGGFVDYTAVKRITNADGTDTLEITVDATASQPFDDDRVAFTAKVEGGEVIRQDDDLTLESGGQFLPMANGVIRTKALINGASSGDEDYIKFHYKRRDGNTLEGITHYEDRNGTPVTQAELIEDEPLVLLPCFHYVATGTVGTATSTVNGFLYDGQSPEDVAVEEHIESGDDLTNWKNNLNNKGSFKIEDGAIKVNALDSQTVGTTEVYEASMTLDWSNTDVDLASVASYAGGFLSYEIQTKLKQAQATDTTDNTYFAGISFKVQDDGTQYGVSLFRPREIEATQADEIELTGTVRDFKADHVDFEKSGEGYGVQTGLVEDELGVEGVPVSTGNYSSYNFAPQELEEWYKDVEDVNKSSEWTITLEKMGSEGNEYYHYQTAAFYPLDDNTNSDETFHPDEPFYSDGGTGSHNYHFTFELHSEFEYSGEETFTFTGDDDVWVFINGHLAIDIGGVHKAESSTLSLDTMKTELEIEVGGVYTFDFFFAERHTTESNFRIDTTIELVELTDGLPGSMMDKSKSGGSSVWPQLPPDNADSPQIDGTTIHGDGWGDNTEDWLIEDCDSDGEWVCVEYKPNGKCKTKEWVEGPKGPEFFDDDKKPIDAEMLDSDCTDDCFKICEDTKPTYYDVWNTNFDWDGNENDGVPDIDYDPDNYTGGAANKQANNTFLILWERKLESGSYKYNWLSYRMLNLATNLHETGNDGIIEDPDKGTIRDWSTLGVRVKEVSRLWVNVTNSTEYAAIKRGDFISIAEGGRSEDGNAGGYCLDKPLEANNNNGMILLYRVNRDDDDNIYQFPDGSPVYLRSTEVGTIYNYQKQVNLIQAYLSTDDEGTPVETPVFALDTERLGNPRDEVNWFPEDHETIDAENDYHRVIQWMGWNSTDYYGDYYADVATNYANYPNDDGHDVLIDKWSRSGYDLEDRYTMDRVFSRLNSILTTLEFSNTNSIDNPEVGIHAFGKVPEDEESEDVVNSGIDMSFDDFAIRATVPIPELGGTIGTAQSR